jgi:hypothetical protein
MTTKQQTLLEESDRFRALAKEAALKTITGDPKDRADQEHKAREHLLRAETYKDAATLIDK